MQRVFHLPVAVIDDLIEFINYLDKTVALQIKKLLVSVDQLLLVVLGFLVHIERLLQIDETILFRVDCLELFVHAVLRLGSRTRLSLTFLLSICIVKWA